MKVTACAISRLLAAGKRNMLPTSFQVARTAQRGQPSMSPCHLPRPRPRPAHHPPSHHHHQLLQGGASSFLQLNIPSRPLTGAPQRCALLARPIGLVPCLQPATTVPSAAIPISSSATQVGLLTFRTTEYFESALSQVPCNAAPCLQPATTVPSAAIPIPPPATTVPASAISVPTPATKVGWFALCA